MSSPEKKRKTTATKTKTKKNPTQQSSPILSLHDDLLLNCLARVSRLYYPTLSLVSKSFRYLIASPELYKTRSLLGRRESCLFVCIQIIYDRNPSWYTLCWKPLTDDTSKSSGYFLSKIPIPNSPGAQYSSLVAVGSNIYNIDGEFHLKTNQKVFVYDSVGRSWEWSKSSCQIENVLYFVYRGVISWYDNEAEVITWRTLFMGLEGLPKFPTNCFVRLAGYGGKLMVFWDEHLPDYHSFSRKIRIWCAEITLERRKNSEIWGKVEWFDHVLTLPLGNNFVAATV